MNSEQIKIVEYIDKWISDLKAKYPDMNFDNVRDGAINSFAKSSEPFEFIKARIDEVFTSAERNMGGIKQVMTKSEESFKMTPHEQEIYGQLKQEILSKREAMGLSNAKKLTLERPNNFDNRGYISFFIIMGIVLAFVVALIVVVCNVLS